jgi:predicted ABC-type ATPase
MAVVDLAGRSRRAGAEALERIAESTEAGKDFAFETILSGRTYLPLLRDVKGIPCSTQS